MNAVFDPHLDALPPAQRTLWRQLDRLRALGFVLYGGTAIALRLGHRISVDFDFFHEQPLDRSALHAACAFLESAHVLQDRPDALSVLVRAPEGGEVKLSLLGPIRFGRVGTPQPTRDGMANVASVDDLMATKLKVILQRAEVKDYIDIAAMLAASVDLARGLAAAKALFGVTFQPSESLKALSSFSDGDLPSLPSPIRRQLIEAVGRVGDLPEMVILSRSLAF